MPARTKDDLVKAANLANMMLGVGILLTVVPCGLLFFTYMSISGDATFGNVRQSLGWTFMVTMALLPLGITMIAYAIGWMVLIKRQIIRFELEADDEEERQQSGF